MNESSPDDPALSLQSTFGPPVSPANMLQSEEQTKDPPHPAPQTQKDLVPDYDYSDKPFRKFHNHNLSDTTTASNESSPTTTISTVDDSSATEPSPGSSPESPPPNTFAAGMIRPRTADDSSFFELQKQPPPRKGRNLKNLAVNTSRNPGGSSSTSLPLPAPDSISSITSPSFVKPPSPPKRKPSKLGLTLLTPGSNKAAPQEIKLSIPPTPSFGRPGTLRHFQSSPSLPVVDGLASQSVAVPQVPRLQPALEPILSPLPTGPEPDEEEEQNFDVPLSKEEKPEAYPDGPICVYEPLIDLYLEPTAEQCRQYDVVMNVASEVLNPLEQQVVPAPDESEIRIDGGGGIQFAPKRDRVVVQKGEKDTLQHENSPTTPKATVSSSDDSAASKEGPEYIHVKWEHNSDIVPDLLGLVKLIDEKVVQGKRVLIHCQCGVSRSASLIVAYGLYKNPSLSVQEAYDAVKRRSKWIGPNMNLIMQLQEFRTSLMRDGLLATDRGLSPLTPSSALSEWAGPFSSSSSAREAPISAGVGPLSAAQTAESLPVFTPAPSSAPSGLAWQLKNAASGQRTRAISAVKPGSAYVNPSGRVVPVVPILKVVEPESAESPKANQQTEQSSKESDSPTPTELPTSPRSEQFAMTPLQPPPDVDPADSFGLMSPTSTEFASSPFDRPALLAQLGMGSMEPRRSLSLKSRPKPQQQTQDDLQYQTPTTATTKPLRGKISTPNLGERGQRLQSLQAEISSATTSSEAGGGGGGGVDEALLSPRATEFTQNPLAMSFAPPPQMPSSTSGAVSDEDDPRSPAQKGGSPIVRNILDVL